MAGSSVEKYSDTIDPTGKSRELTVLCTADDGAATYPSTDLANLSGLTHGPLTGWGLWMVETAPGATGPTDDSDFVLNSANGTDLLGGNGANAIDNATKNLVYPPVSPMVIGPTLTLVISNNAVNSATVYIKLCLVRN
jgi:hypothetical protein